MALDLSKLTQGLGAVTDTVGGNTSQLAGLGAQAGSLLGPAGGLIGGAIGGVGGLAVDLLTAKQRKEEAEKNRKLNVATELNALGEQRPQLKFGGPKKLVHFDGRTHEMGGITLSTSEVEDGETGYGNYVFSDTIGPKGTGKSFARMSKDIEKRYFRKNDPLTQAAMHRDLSRLIEQQEEVRGLIGEGGNVPSEYLCKGGYKASKDNASYALGGYLTTDPNAFMMGDNPSSNPIGNVNGDNPFLTGTQPNDLAMPITQNFQISPTDTSPIGDMFVVPSGQVEPPVQNESLLDRTLRFGNRAADLAGGELGGASAALLPGLTAAVTNRLLMDRVNYPRVSARTVDAQLLDPTRALQQVGTAFSGQEASIQGLSGGTGINARLALAATEANQRAGVTADYEARNRAILSQTDQFNAGQRAQADAINLQQSQQEIQDRNAAFAGVGQSIGSSIKNYAEELSKQRAEANALRAMEEGNYRYDIVNGKVVPVVQSSLGRSLFRTPLNSTFGQGSVDEYVNTPFSEKAMQEAEKNFTLNLADYNRRRKSSKG